MPFYHLKVNLNSAANQAAIVDLIRGNKDEVIQVSDGLCIKSASDIEALVTLLEPQQVAPESLSEISPDSVDLSPDQIAFMKPN